MKVCIKCHISKDESAFYKHSSKTNKLKNACKSCIKDNLKIVRKTDRYKEYMKIYTKVYRKKDKYKRFIKNYNLKYYKSDGYKKLLDNLKSENAKERIMGYKKKYAISEKGRIKRKELYKRIGRIERYNLKKRYLISLIRREKNKYENVDTNILIEIKRLTILIKRAKKLINNQKNKNNEK